MEIEEKKEETEEKKEETVEKKGETVETVEKKEEVKELEVMETVEKTEREGEARENAQDSTCVLVMSTEEAGRSSTIPVEGNADMTESISPENPASVKQSKDCCLIL